MRRLITWFVCCVVAGCSASVSAPARTTSVDPHVTVSETRDEAQAVRDFAHRLHAAPDPLVEADTLRRFHSYLADHQLLFQVHSMRDANQSAYGGAQMRMGGPLITRVDVFRGQERIESFTFTPLDTSNLAILGQ